MSGKRRASEIKPIVDISMESSASHEELESVRNRLEHCSGIRRVEILSPQEVLDERLELLKKYPGIRDQYSVDDCGSLLRCHMLDPSSARLLIERCNLGELAGVYNVGLNFTRASRI